MKRRTKVLTIAAGVVVVILIAGIFTKKNYSIEREITIRRSKEDVFNYVKYLKNQDHYNKWSMMDPFMKKAYEGVDGTEGFVSKWESDKAGKGEQQINSIREGERIDIALHFIEPFSGEGTAYIQTVGVAERETRVKWAFSSGMKYPMNMIMWFVDMEGIMSKDLDESLMNLKKILEKESLTRKQITNG